MPACLATGLVRKRWYLPMSKRPSVCNSGFCDTPGRRIEPSRVLNLFIRDGDAPPLVLLTEQDVIHEFIEHAVLELATFVQRDAASEPLRFLFLEILHSLFPLQVQNILTIDLGDDGVGRHRGSTEQARAVHEQEATDERDDEDDPDVFRSAPHGLQHGAGLLRTGRLVTRPIRAATHTQFRVGLHVGDKQ